MALRLNTSEKNEIMPRRKARAEKLRLAQMLLRSGSLAGVESSVKPPFSLSISLSVFLLDLQRRNVDVSVCDVC